MSAHLVGQPTADLTVGVVGSFGLVFALIGVAALLTVAGLVVLARSRRGPR